MKRRVLAGMSALIGELRSFVHWWTQQLRSLAMTALRAMFPRLQIHTFVTLQRTGGTFSVRRAGKLSSLFSFHKQPDAVWPADLKAFGSVEVVKGARCAIALTSDFVLTHKLTFPEAAESNLESAIALYLEREFPLKLDTVSVTHEVIRRVRDQRQLVVRVRIVRRDVVNQVVMAAQVWGMRVVQLGVANGDDQIEGNFLGRATLKKRWSLSRIDHMLLASVGATALLAQCIVASQWAFERYRARSLITIIEADARGAQRAARLLDEKAAPARLISTIALQPDVAAMVEHLTSRTPADTWIYHVSIKAPPLSLTTLEISAYTPPSLDYGKTLENADEFEQVRLISSEPSPSSPSLKRAHFTAVASLPTADAVGASVSTP